VNRRARPLAAAALLAALCAGCASGPPPLASGPPIPPPGTPVVYAALGASETTGVGLNDPYLRARYAWPQLFFNMVLPRAATYYNFGVPGITTAAALGEEVPQALAVHPAVVTVFFNVDDLVHAVPAATFGANLDAIVHTMRQGGRARVLIANAPSLDNLPAFRACQGLSAGSATCPVPADVAIPSQQSIDASLDAYDTVIAAVATREGATLVDLRAHSDQLVTHPEDVAADGLHPSPLGDQVIAQLFAAAYSGSPSG